LGHICLVNESGYCQDTYMNAYIFKVKLSHNKRTWRKVAILGSDSLYNFASIINRVFDFDFDHCFGFFDNFKKIYDSKEKYELFADLPDVESDPESKSVKKTKVSQVFKKLKQKMLFFFDYGDCWEFEVEFLGQKNLDTKKKLPLVLDSKGESPDQYPAYEEDD